MTRNEGRFTTISRAALGIVNSLVNVEHKNAEKQQSIQNLLKLLYDIGLPADEDPRLLPNKNLTFVREHILEKRISLVPRIPNPEERDKCLAIVTFNNFAISDNKEYNAHVMSIDVVVPTNVWLTGTIYGSVPRVFLIMDEIQKLIDKKQFDGLGVMELQTVRSFALTPELIGYSMIFGNMDFK